ncbi:hypothetical protein D1872_36340 [compost metagenome]
MWVIILLRIKVKTNILRRYDNMSEIFTVDRKEFFLKLMDDEINPMCLYVNREGYQIEIEVNAWEPFKGIHNVRNAIKFDKSDLIRYRDIEYSINEDPENVEKNIEPVSIWISDGDLMNIMSKTDSVAVKHSHSRTDVQMNKVTFETIREYPQYNAATVKSEHIKKIMRYTTEQEFHEIPVDYPVIICVEPSQLTNAIIESPDLRISIGFRNEIYREYSQGIRIRKAVHVDVKNQIMTINVADIIEILDIDKFISKSANMFAYSKWSESKNPYKFWGEAFGDWRKTYLNSVGIAAYTSGNDDENEEVEGVNTGNHTKDHDALPGVLKKEMVGVCGYNPHDYSRLEDEKIIRELTTIYKLKKKIEYFIEENERWNWFGLMKPKTFRLHEIIEELTLFKITSTEFYITLYTSLGDMVIYRNGTIYYYGDLDRYIKEFARRVINNATMFNSVLSLPKK